MARNRFERTHKGSYKVPIPLLRAKNQHPSASVRQTFLCIFSSRGVRPQSHQPGHLLPNLESEPCVLYALKLLKKQLVGRKVTTRSFATAPARTGSIHSALVSPKPIFQGYPLPISLSTALIVFCNSNPPNCMH